jgi:hypothetical protein
MTGNLKMRSDFRFNLRILLLGAAVIGVAVTALASQLSMAHIVVASFLPLLFLAVATKPPKAPPDAELSGLFAFIWTVFATYKSASIATVIVFSLSFAVIGYYTGGILELRSKKVHGSDPECQM